MATFVTEPKLYERDDPAYVFVKCVSASEKLIELGCKRRITVNTGEVGIARVNGKLTVLEPKIHFQERNEETFEGFLSVLMQQIQLTDGDAPDAKDGKAVDDWLRCDTQELVEIGIKAALFYEVVNPALCITRLGTTASIQKNLKDTGISTLQGIMRSSNLNQVAQSKVIDVGHENKTAAPRSEGAPIFFDRVHDEFLAKLQSVYVKEYGIMIANIRIEDFKLMNVELARNISNQAMSTAQNQNQLANLASQREITAATQERDATSIAIQARAAAAKLQTETESRSKAIIMEAQTNAQRTRMLAEAEAEAKSKAFAIRTLAEAEAAGIEMKSAAENKRAENLASTDFGKQLTLETLRTEMMSRCFQGVSKIVYLPNDKNLGGLPLQFYGSQGLQVDNKSPL